MVSTRYPRAAQGCVHNITLTAINAASEVTRGGSHSPGRPDARAITLLDGVNGRCDALLPQRY